MPGALAFTCELTQVLAGLKGAAWKQVAATAQQLAWRCRWRNSGIRFVKPLVQGVGFATVTPGLEPEESSDRELMMATKMLPVNSRLDLEFRGDGIRTGLGAGGQRQGVDDGHEDAAGARRRTRHCRRDQRLRNTQPVGGKISIVIFLSRLISPDLAQLSTIMKETVRALVLLA